MHWSENTLMLEASYIGHQFILFTKIIADALISHLKTAKYRRSEQLQLFIECLMRRWFSWKMFVRHTFKKVVAMWMAELETCQSARRRVDCQKWSLGNSLWPPYRAFSPGTQRQGKQDGLCKLCSRGQTAVYCLLSPIACSSLPSPSLLNKPRKLSYSSHQRNCWGLGHFRSVFQPECFHVWIWVAFQPDGTDWPGYLSE